MSAGGLGQDGQNKLFYIHSFNYSYQYRQVCGFAAGHNAVGCNFFYCGQPHAGLHFKDNFMTAAFRASQHAVDSFLGGRNDRESVSPAVVNEITVEVVAPIKIIFSLNGYALRFDLMFQRNFFYRLV